MDIMEITIQRFCPRCKTEKPTSEFYNRRKKTGNSVYCKPCTSDQTLERQRGLKAKGVAYLGGKCMDCGFVGHPAIFDFHHRDPNLKSFSIANQKCTSFDKVKDELDKCDLLCSNCHRMKHVNY